MRLPNHQVALLACLGSAAPPTVAEEEWTAFDDPAAVQRLFSGKTAILYKTWPQFYRADGNMVEYDKTNDLYTIRKWNVSDDAKLCWAIFSKPDRVIDCAVIARKSGDPNAFRYEWEHAAGKSPFEFIDAPTERMVEELEKASGPAN